MFKPAIVKHLPLVVDLPTELVAAPIVGHAQLYAANGEGPVLALVVELLDDGCPYDAAVYIDASGRFATVRIGELLEAP